MKRLPVRFTLLLLTLFTAFVFPGCSQAQTHYSVTSLPMLNHTDTLSDGKQCARFENFLVRNFDYSKAMAAYLDSFVSKHKAQDFARFGRYTILFYKESAWTNEQNLKKNPRDLDRYANQYDWVYEYTWIDGNLRSRHVLKNGEIIEPGSDVRVEDPGQRK